MSQARTTISKPRFSIVIPTYNRADTVVNTLNSCFAQTCGDFEIVIVDDGSSDNTVDVLRGIDDERLRVVVQENGGPAAARNTGMREARGEYIAFLDSDDVWYPPFLEQVNEALEAQADQVVYGRIIVDRGVNRYWVKPSRAIHDGESIYDYMYLHGGFIQTSTIVIPARLAESVSWDESVTYGDNDQFAIDCWRTGIHFHMIDKPMTLYADYVSDDALSQLPMFNGGSSKVTNFFRWMDSQSDRMSPEATLAFRAHHVSASLARQSPMKSIGLVLRAYRGNALGLSGVLRQLMQNFTPRLYRRVVDLFVRWRGVPLHTLER